MLDTFLETGKISTYFKPIDKYNKNICYLSATRIRVNKECCDRFTKNKKYETLTLSMMANILLHKI